MKFNLQLQSELEKISPEWTWKCEILDLNSPKANWPKKACVYAANKQTGKQTLPVFIDGSLETFASIPQTARFIFRILEKTETSFSAVEKPRYFAQPVRSCEPELSGTFARLKTSLMRPLAGFMHLLQPGRNALDVAKP